MSKGCSGSGSADDNLKPSRVITEDPASDKLLKASAVIAIEWLINPAKKFNPKEHGIEQDTYTATQYAITFPHLYLRSFYNLLINIFANSLTIYFPLFYRICLFIHPASPIASVDFLMNYCYTNKRQKQINTKSMLGVPLGLRDVLTSTLIT